MQLEGVAPGSLNEEGQLWTLQMRGGSVDGERLAFRAVVGEPTGPPPDAVFRIRFDSFGAELAIQGLSPVQFDASASRGEGLSYVIEFGDGQFSTERTAIHAIDGTGQLWARMTVVDRFGRTDSEVITYAAVSMVNSDITFWLNLTPATQHLKFTARQGLRLTGFHNAGTPMPIVATLSGERDIHIVVEGAGIEFSGHIELGSDLRRRRMVLTQSGGPDHGRVWTYRFHPTS